MKKRFFIMVGLAVALSYSLTLSSCGSDDDDDPEPTPSPTPSTQDTTSNQNKPDDPTVKPDNPTDTTTTNPTDTTTTNPTDTTTINPPEPAFTVTFDVTGSDIEVENLQFDDAATLPSASRKGYSFLGWSTSKDSKEITYNAGDSIEAQSTTLYAVWKLEMYTLTFHYDYTNPSYTDQIAYTAVDVENGRFSLYSWLNHLPSGYSLLGWKEQDSDVVYKLSEKFDTYKDMVLYPVVAKSSSLEQWNSEYYEGH